MSKIYKREIITYNIQTMLDTETRNVKNVQTRLVTYKKYEQTTENVKTRHGIKNSSSKSDQERKCTNEIRSHTDNVKNDERRRSGL